MKYSNYFFGALSMALLMASCAKEPVMDDVVDPNLIPLNISGSINQIHTKATDQGFVDGDAVGLYAVNYTDNNATAGTLLVSGNQADNVKYVLDESSHKWSPVKNVYYKDVNTNVDLYLYYPYQESITNMTAGTFEVSKDQSTAKTSSALGGYEASDFLWGKSAGVVPSESSVGVQLSHKLSAVNLTLVKGTGFDNDDFDNLSKSVIVVNTTRKATIDYTTGTATKVGDPQLDGIVMCPQSDGSFRAIVIPQTVAANKTIFKITIDGISYDFSQNVATNYLAGKQLNANITVNKKADGSGVQLVIGDWQISEWTEDKNTHGGEARQYYVVNVATPGTLGTLIRAAGKNPAKIKNLKVNGTINIFDFAFVRDSMSIIQALNLKDCVSKCYPSSMADSYYIYDYDQLDENQRKEIVYITSSGRPMMTYNSDESKYQNIIPAEAFYGKKYLTTVILPANTSIIDEGAFIGTNISGAIVLPDTVIEIGERAFQNTNITSIALSKNLEKILSHAFSGCSSLSGSLSLPETVKYIGRCAFEGCKFSGCLRLPNSIEYLGSGAFNNSGSFSGDLIIPEKVNTLYGNTFSSSGFTGRVNINNVTTLGDSEFASCGISGELVIPSDIKEIPSNCFRNTNISSLIIPESVIMIKSGAFCGCSSLTGQITIPEGVISIESEAFKNCGNILGISLPSTLQTIRSSAFYGCYYISKIIASSLIPPTVQSGAFDGVAKDNFTVEVPAQSVKKYQSESGWQDFKRIAAHYDFSMSRERMRALNAGITRTYTLRAPSGFGWTVSSKPDWVTVTPDHGTGKTEVSITIATMDRTSETFEVNEGSFNSPSYKKYKGRAGEVVFNLIEKDYTCSMDVEQYDYDYADGDVVTYNTASTGGGVDIVFIGDGYDAKDIAKGTFLANAESGFSNFFDLEPYKTYKSYFNVKAVISMSDESGIGTVNTIIDTKFGSYFTQNRIKSPSPESCFSWAKKANANLDLTKSLVIMMMNTSTYEGVTMMYSDGSAIACCPVSTASYPYDYRGIIQHEAGGHGFGKLGDEYIYHNAFIQTCICNDGCEHPAGDDDTSKSYGIFKSLGWYKNLSMTGDAKQVPWAHLIYNSKYSDYVDMYEGGYMHSRGVYRSEATSCMNNNVPYYSAISRQAIVERIMYCAGETFDLSDFYAKDKDTFGTVTKASYSKPLDRTFGIDPVWNRGSEEGSVIYMGEHPDYSKIK